MNTTTLHSRRLAFFARFVARIKLAHTRSTLKACEHAHSNIQNELRALVEDRNQAATRCAQLRCRVAEIELLLQHGDFAAFSRPAGRK